MTVASLPSFYEWAIVISFAVLPIIASFYLFGVWRRKHNGVLLIQHFLILSIFCVFVLRKFVTLALFALVDFRVESSPFCTAHDIAIYFLKFMHYVYVLLFSIELSVLTKSRFVSGVMKLLC